MAITTYPSFKGLEVYKRHLRANAQFHVSILVCLVSIWVLTLGTVSHRPVPTWHSHEVQRNLCYNFRL